MIMLVIVVFVAGVIAVVMLNARRGTQSRDSRRNDTLNAADSGSIDPISAPSRYDDHRHSESDSVSDSSSSDSGSSGGDGGGGGSGD